VITESTQLADAAQLLCDAQSSANPIQPLTRLCPNLDVAQAIRCSISTWAATSTRVVLRGRKIGLPPRMQELLGVNEPDFGYILDSMVLPDGAAPG